MVAPNLYGSSPSIVFKARRATCLRTSYFPELKSSDTLLDVALAKPGGPATAVSNSGSQSGAFRSTIVVVVHAY
eukprot:Stramenopile-MAST_4_protein_6246